MHIRVNNNKIADVLNFYLDILIDTLNLFSCSTHVETVSDILKRSRNHQGRFKLKQDVNNSAKFSFQPLSVHTAKEFIEGWSSNKATAWGIPIKILKESRFTFEYFTYYTNETILS